MKPNKEIYDILVLFTSKFADLSLAAKTTGEYLNLVTAIIIFKSLIMEDFKLELALYPEPKVNSEQISKEIEEYARLIIVELKNSALKLNKTALN